MSELQGGEVFELHEIPHGKHPPSNREMIIDFASGVVGGSIREGD